MIHRKTTTLKILRMKTNREKNHIHDPDRLNVWNANENESVNGETNDDGDDDSIDYTVIRNCKKVPMIIRTASTIRSGGTVMTSVVRRVMSVTRVMAMARTRRGPASLSRFLRFIKMLFSFHWFVTKCDEQSARWGMIGHQAPLNSREEIVLFCTVFLYWKEFEITNG